MNWLEAKIDGEKDTIVAKATYQKNWQMWVNMKGLDIDDPVFVTGLDKDGIDIDDEQVYIHAPDIVLVFVKGFSIAFSAKKEGVSFTCKYTIRG